MMMAKAEADNTQRSLNEYSDAISDMQEGYVGNLFSDGIVETINSETLLEWLSNPDDNFEDIQNYMSYLYYSNGIVYQLYTIIRTLSDLNYSIEVIDSSAKSNEKSLQTIRQMLKKIKHKEVTRDLLTQACVNGTVVCTWLGDKKNPYLHIFDKTKWVFPKFRRNGEWVAVIDMAWFDEMDEETERVIWFETLKGVVSESDYNAYQNDTSNDEKRYIELPQETTKVIRVNTLFRNQRIGLPMGTQYLQDLVHKNSFRALENTIVNKVVRNVATLTVGNKEVPYLSLNKNVRKKVTEGVYNTLQKSVTSDGTPLAVIPEWAKLEFASLDGLDGLDNDKYEAVDNDSSIDSGLPTPMFTGKDGSSASMKYAYTFLYKRIGEILEQIDDVYNKGFYFVLGNKSENFWMEYDKRIPLDAEKVLSALQSLHAEGFALKPIIDILPDVEFQNYIAQSLYEQETLDLYSKIKPPATSYTQSGSETGDDDSKGGAPEKKEEDLSDEGAKTRDGDKNANKE